MGRGRANRSIHLRGYGASLLCVPLILAVVVLITELIKTALTVGSAASFAHADALSTTGALATALLLGYVLAFLNSSLFSILRQFDVPRPSTAALRGASPITGWAVNTRWAKPLSANQIEPSHPRAPPR